MRCVCLCVRGGATDGVKGVCEGPTTIKCPVRKKKKKRFKVKSCKFQLVKQQLGADLKKLCGKGQ